MKKLGNEITKAWKSFKFRYASFCLAICAIAVYSLWKIKCIPLEQINLTKKFLLSLSFGIGGFGLLVLKLWLKNLHGTMDNEELDRIKWRYFTYYPIMLTVLAVVSMAISLRLFELKTSSFLASMGLVSFFLGYFVDALPTIVEKLGDKVGGK